MAIQLLAHHCTTVLISICSGFYLIRVSLVLAALYVSPIHPACARYGSHTCSYGKYCIPWCTTPITACATGNSLGAVVLRKLLP